MCSFLKFFFKVVQNFLKVDPLDWWRSNEKHLALLASLARAFLCTPPTLSSSERAFSQAGMIITQKRTKLKPDTAQRLAFVQLNMQRLLPLISHVPIDESEEKENAEVLDLGEETDDEE